MRKYILMVFLLVFYSISYGDLNYCDNSNVNSDLSCGYSEFSNTVGGLTSFTGSYYELPIGSDLEKLSIIEKEEPDYDVYLGDIGNNFSYKKIYDTIDYYPVGSLEIYKFDSSIELPEVGYREFGENAPVTVKKKSKLGNNSCNEVDMLNNVNIELQNDGFSDYLRISWDYTEDNVELIQLLPKRKSFNVTGKNYFDVLGLKDKASYYFNFKVHNNCGNDKYFSQDIYVYRKNYKTNPYLEIDSGYIKFIDQNNISFGEPTLKCFSGYKGIINTEFKIGNLHKVQDYFLKKDFWCLSTYKDNSLEYLNTDILNYTPDNNFYITNRELIDIFIGGDGSVDFFNKKYYYLYDKIDLEKNSTYEDFLLLYLNIKLDKKVIDSSFFYSYLNDILKTNHNSKKKITKSEVTQLISNYNLYIKLNEVYNNGIEVDTKLVLKYITYNRLISKELLLLDDRKREELLDCFSYMNCKNIEDYKIINTKVLSYLETKKNYDTYKIKSYRDFSKLLYKTYLDNNLYGSEKYNKFIDILVEAVNYDAKFYDIYTYNSFVRINNKLLEGDLDYKLNRLYSNLPEIISMYDNIKDKSKLLNKIGGYLR